MQKLDIKCGHRFTILICKSPFSDHDEQEGTVSYVVIDELQEKFGPAVSLVILSFQVYYGTSMIKDGVVHVVSANLKFVQNCVNITRVYDLIKCRAARL